jgi:lipopolysaccharide transport system ATP-binding protein
MTASASAQNAPVVLRVKGVSKEYRLYASPRERFKALFSSRARHRSHWALKDLNFELKRGQCVGVVGDNGAGKSSLLKLLAGTMQPSSGTVERVGRVTAILELGAGFHPEFSGRANLYFAGSLIGIDREAMGKLEAEIIEFSELGEAMDRAVKTYSSGMTVRLAFALVTAVRPDVLIIDEALAVGDQNFQKKCIDRILSFRQAGCTILFCSHSPYHIRQLCDSALWMEKGRIRAHGPTEQVLCAYEQQLQKAATVHSVVEEVHSPAAAEPVVPVQGAGVSTLAHIVSLEIDGLEGERPPVLLGSDLVVTIRVVGHLDECPNIGFMLERVHGSGITSIATHDEGVHPVRHADGSWQSVITFPNLPLHTGEYVVSAYLFDASGLVIYEEWLRYRSFQFVAETRMPGLVRLPHHWA